MKVVPLLKYSLVILLIIGCTPTRRVSFSNNNIKNFKHWKEDSIKSFLSGDWIRIGRYDGKNIVEDTLGTFYYHKNDKLIATTRIINPKGLFHLVNDSITKQDEIPSIGFDFRLNGIDLIEKHCTPPDFESCSFSFSCYSIDYLIFDNGKPIRKIYTNGKIKRIKNPIHYLNQNLILIDEIAYVKSNKWVEYAANNGYNPAGMNE